MSPLWVLPLVVLAIGAAAVAFVARSTLTASRELETELRGLRGLADELAELQVSVDATRRRGAQLADIRARARAARLAAKAEAHTLDR